MRHLFVGVRAIAAVYMACCTATIARAQRSVAPTVCDASQNDRLIDQLLADPTAIALLKRGEGATVGGVVRDSMSGPLRNARVKVSGVKGEWRADGSGAFVIRGVPPGARVVVISAVGFFPVRRLVCLANGDSATVDVAMPRLITKLDTVAILGRQNFVNALKDDINQRRRSGFGFRSDSLELARLPGVVEAFNFPGVRAQLVYGMVVVSMTGRGPKSMMGPKASSLSCNAPIWIDGRQSSGDVLASMLKEEIALIEVYNSSSGTPLQFQTMGNSCGIVLVWRKSYITP